MVMTPQLGSVFGLFLFLIFSRKLFLSNNLALRLNSMAELVVVVTITAGTICLYQLPQDWF